MECIACKNGSFDYIFNRMLVKCKSCGFTTADGEYKKEELFNIYSNRYFNGDEYLNYVADKYSITLNFERRLKYINKIYKSYSPHSAVEIGCAYGFFGEVFNNKYPLANYIGFDIAKDACAHAAEVLKLNVKCIEFDKYQTNDKFTDIYMWDVIEHLPRPDLIMNKISELSKKESRLFITTGDIGAWLPSWQKEKWRLIHPPSHLHYFNNKSIRILLERYGFRVVKIVYPSIARSLKQIYYSLFMLDKKPSQVHSFIYKLLPEKTCVSINTFDVMFVIAEKI